MPKQSKGNKRGVPQKMASDKRRSKAIHKKQDMIDYFNGEMPDAKEQGNFAHMNKDKNAERIRDLPITFYELYDDFEEDKDRGLPFKSLPLEEQNRLHKEMRDLTGLMKKRQSKLTGEEDNSDRDTKTYNRSKDNVTDEEGRQQEEEEEEEEEEEPDMNVPLRIPKDHFHTCIEIPSSVLSFKKNVHTEGGGNGGDDEFHLLSHRLKCELFEKVTKFNLFENFIQVEIAKRAKPGILWEFRFAAFFEKMLEIGDIKCISAEVTKDKKRAALCFRLDEDKDLFFLVIIGPLVDPSNSLLSILKDRQRVLLEEKNLESQKLKKEDIQSIGQTKMRFRGYFYVPCGCVCKKKGVFKKDYIHNG